MKIRPSRYLIPDVAVFLGPEPQDVPDTPPLIAIEITSPDDCMPDVLEKLEEFRNWGVPHIWLVDPNTRWMYVYTGGLDRVQSLRVPELEVDLAPDDIFGPAAN